MQGRSDLVYTQHLINYYYQPKKNRKIYPKGKIYHYDESLPARIPPNMIAPNHLFETNLGGEKRGTQSQFIMFKIERIELNIIQ